MSQKRNQVFPVREHFGKEVSTTSKHQQAQQQTTEVTQDKITTIKVVSVGDKCSGKTQILIAINGPYPDIYFPKELYDFPEKTVCSEGKIYTLLLWQTTGQEDYDRLRPVTYPQTDVFLVCFSIDNPSTIENAFKKWVPEIQHHCPKTPFLLVGTKNNVNDLTKDQKPREELSSFKNNSINKEELLLRGKKLNAFDYIECCAVKNEGIESLIDKIILAAISPSKQKGEKSKMTKDKEQKNCSLQ
ncbi:cell division control protein 42 homolog isoform X2 [Clavelina lepadiformis]|uniref:cell division control protein 42 homolog isoform X2 n=1 Tax=Clavelina lepadiformis TaxID=159417 RepID=UPI00404264B0